MTQKISKSTHGLGAEIDRHMDCCTLMDWAKFKTGVEDLEGKNSPMQTCFEVGGVLGPHVRLSAIGERMTIF